VTDGRTDRRFVRFILLWNLERITNCVGSAVRVNGQLQVSAIDGGRTELLAVWAGEGRCVM
jgi:hypothetical protein